MKCVWITNQKGQACIYGCGTVLKRDYDERPVCVCPGPPQQATIQAVRNASNLTQAALSTGLGDWTEALLKSFGVTQDKYKAAKEQFGLAPTCNCPGRIENLNKWGDAVKAWWNKEN